MKESTPQALPGIDLDQLTRYEPTDGSEGPFMYANPSGEWLMRAEVAALIAQARAAQMTGSAPTDLSHQLRDIAKGIGNGEYTQVRPQMLNAAADEIERYYGGMVAWKKTAEKKDRDWNAERMGRVDDRCTARAAQAGPNFDKLHSDIMNLPCDASPYDHARSERIAYKYGHRDARHAAAELVNVFAAQCEGAAQARPSDDDLWDQTLRDRDTYHEWADKLAEAIAKHFDTYIGEHSNMNCPWAEALEVIENHEDEKPLHFEALLPGPYYMDPPDGGSVSLLEQFRRMAEDAAQWRAHVASAAPSCEHCGTRLPLHLLTCPVSVKGMAEGKKKEAPEPLRQLLIDLSNNTYFCGLHLNDDAKYVGYLREAEKAEQAIIELFGAAQAAVPRKTLIEGND